MKNIIQLFLLTTLLYVACDKSGDESSTTILAPSVESISPVRGRAGTIVSLKGENFSRSRIDNRVTIAGKEAKIITFNEHSIHVEIPESDTFGPVELSLAVNGKPTAVQTFDYMEPLLPYDTQTLAGSGTANYAEGMGNVAGFNNPEGVAIDSKGNILVADRSNHRIRKITPEGLVSTLAGTGRVGRADGLAAEASFNSPWKIAVDQHDNVIVADRSNHLIRKISAAGIVTTLAGTGAGGYQDGAALSASFDYPQDVEVDAQGNIYIVDYTNNRIRRLDTQGMVITLAGGVSGYADGMGTEARFNRPSGIVMDAQGNLLVADRNNHRIRKITPDGLVSTLAGNGEKGLADSELLEASFSEPFGVSVDRSGNIYVADLASNAIRKITIYGEVVTIAGNGNAGAQNGTGTQATFRSPTDVVVSANGVVYIADLANHLVRTLRQK